ncbi:hypothetical protein [Streptomyces sp. SJL17-1]|uniref:hypothetical protein n=1 Tax=Streptomyces sp. SJL17-1 TaxID=2967223 RepID=UPI00296706C3|nr:hypothetical protein [Streptomyces sp. SJL17-1]
MALAQEEGFVLEWSGDRHAAINVPADRDSTAFEGFPREQREAGTLFWEWSDARPFEAPRQ